MRAFAFALAASLALASASEASLALASAGEARPSRVVSLNLCTDELLLMLAAPEQIASVTHLSQSPAESAVWRQARRHRRNDGSLISTVPLRPDLLLTMGGGVRDRAGIAARLGLKTLDLPYPDSLADVKASIEQVAAAIGRDTAGRQLVRRIETLQRSAPRRQRDTIWLGGGGQSVSDTGLGAQWMRLAGYRQRRLAGERVSLEQLLVQPPEILLRSDYRGRQYSAGQRWLGHPLAGGTSRSRSVRTDGRRWTCMGPTLIAEIERLRG
jgi:iron complex transport system substrate-binding protein